MGRRNKDFKLLEMIATTHYGFGLAITLFWLLMSEIFIPILFGGINGEFGKQLLISIVPFIQWLFRAIAGISLLATIYSFVSQRKHDR